MPKPIPSPKVTGHNFLLKRTRENKEPKAPPVVFGGDWRLVTNQIAVRSGWRNDDGAFDKQSNKCWQILSPAPVLTMPSARQRSQTAESFPSDISTFTFSWSEQFCFRVRMSGDLLRVDWPLISSGLISWPGSGSMLAKRKNWTNSHFQESRLLRISNHRIFAFAVFHDFIETF